MPTPYDIQNPDPRAARRIMLDWLRANPTGQLDLVGAAYEPYVEWVAGGRDARVLAFHLTEVFWELVVEGIIAPGCDAWNLDLPFYHLTGHGRTVLQGEAGHPHDEGAYLARVRANIPGLDDTVMAYLTESLRAFRRGTYVAATIVLGIAAERVFLLLCASLLAALRDPGERAVFEGIMQRLPMKPKLDWVHNKIQELQARRMPSFPDNATLAVSAIYDFLRTQRNDLGHPREQPPTIDREEAFVNLQIVPRYYQTADAVRQFLAEHQVCGDLRRLTYRLTSQWTGPQAPIRSPRPVTAGVRQHFPGLAAGGTNRSGCDEAYCKPGSSSTLAASPPALP
jgi:hypothetical protein